MLPHPKEQAQRRLAHLGAALTPARAQHAAQGSAGIQRMPDKVAIVTGGANGIGAATCLVLAEQGCAVALGDLDADAGERLASRIRRDGGRSLFVQTDVSNEASVSELAQRTIETFGQVDVLVNSAGVNVLARLLDTSVERWDTTQHINLRSVFLATKAVLPQMIQQGKGSVISVSSIQGTRGFPNFPAYAVSTHSVPTPLAVWPSYLTHG
jgi:NAD(P)-dependent dehydrogenase (short-subunit alcohol dehydrogenase family)